MGYGSLAEYQALLDQLSSTRINTPKDIVSNLTGYNITIYKSDLENSYGEPMKAIGVYIAVASLCCLLAILADLVSGLWSRKIWLPVKYFPLNALTLAGIAIAMKLPVDLSGAMLGDMDQAAKLGSLAFLCIMMAHFLPSLATMNKNELLTNVIALGILVITLVVNVCIQINSGVVGRIPKDRNIKNLKDLELVSNVAYTAIAIVYVTFLLLLLMIHVSSSFAILKSKEIIESKYQKGHEQASNDLKSSREFSTVENLQQHVSKYWIMARSGSPQFISACFATTAATGVICLLTALFHFMTMVWITGLVIDKINDRKSVVLFDSVYDWSTIVICAVQSLGIVLGTVAPVLRCFSPISLNLTIKSMSNLFKIEKYWAGKLHDWKYGSIALPLLSISLPFGNHKRKVVIRTLKNLFLNLCILLQLVVVVVCKIIVLILFFPTLFLHCLKWLFHDAFRSHTKNKEIYDIYVLQPVNENKLMESTLRHLLKSANRLIQKSEKKQPKNLMKLIQEKSTQGFQGVRMFDNDVHGVKCSPTKVEYQDCWSLPVVTLTTIAITLPKVEKEKVKSLLKSVREGLEYVILVEETLNNDDDYERTQKATKMLWEEVDFRHKWLGIKLKDIASQVNKTTSQIVQQFLANANKKIIEGRGSLDDESIFTSICASSMSRISQTIINNQESHNDLFDELSSWIADIMAACLTNLPQAIVEKCHTSVVEKREASVEAAAKLLGETKQIINTLEGPLQNKWHAYLRMATEGRPFINKWRAHLSEP